MERSAGVFKFHDHKISLQTKTESLPSTPLHAHSEASPWEAGCVSKLGALRGGSSYLLGHLEPKLAWVLAEDFWLQVPLFGLCSHFFLSRYEKVKLLSTCVTAA